jgi:hypothetical protein
LSSSLPAWGLVLALAGGFAPGAAQGAEGKRVALVIGIGEYPNLPAELRLPHAREDVEAIAQILREKDGFEVMELKEGFATRQAIESFLVQSLPGMVGPADTLLIYIEAHGMGADFDDPYVLPYDARSEDIENTGMRISDLGRRVRDAVNVRALVLLTDTAHAGDLGGLALLGPNARSWPELPENTFILSASSMREPATEGLFAPLLVRAFSGEADASRDGVLTASELHRFILDQAVTASGDKMHPTDAGHYAPGLELFPVPAVVPVPVVGSETTPGPEPLPVEPTSAPVRERKRRWAVAVPALAGAAALAVPDFITYRRGRPKYAILSGDEPLPDGVDLESVYLSYKRLHTINWVTGIGAGVLAATGGFFALVPVQDGAAVGMSVRF